MSDCCLDVMYLPLQVILWCYERKLDCGQSWQTQEVGAARRLEGFNAWRSIASTHSSIVHLV
jgi:hypothetical protein